VLLTGVMLSMLALLRSSEHSAQIQGAAAVKKIVVDDRQQGMDAVVSAGIKPLRAADRDNWLTMLVPSCRWEHRQIVVKLAKTWDMSMYLNVESGTYQGEVDEW
jgi:hypothetical protein